MCSEADKLKAKQRYLSGNMTLKALSEETGIGYSTLTSWARKEKWSQARASIEDQAFRKAAVKAVNKKARELCKLLAASDELEKALLLAAKAFSAYLEGERSGETLTDKKTWADNLNHIVAAIGKQAETRMMLSGIMARDEEEKIALMRRKQSLEERKEQQEAGGGLGVVMDRETEELAE
ncbi:MAG: transposase [Clostridia bacterium]|nr:transposase [Clostridia bacterium]